MEIICTSCAEFFNNASSKPEVYQGIRKERMEKMNVFFYEVVSIDGDYANLRRTDVEESDLKLVARALLPQEIAEGDKLKYEWMQYEIIHE